jgi:Flp pilus assembly protein protease CpaA
LWTAAAGGVLAVGALAVRSIGRRIGKWFGREWKSAEAPGKETIPYAPAIALGVWLSLVPKG